METGKEPVVTVFSFHKGEDILVVRSKNNVGVREELKFLKYSGV